MKYQHMQVLIRTKDQQQEGSVFKRLCMSAKSVVCDESFKKEQKIKHVSQYSHKFHVKQKWHYHLSVVSCCGWCLKATAGFCGKPFVHVRCPLRFA